jgi:hypothetical protein
VSSESAPPAPRRRRARREKPRWALILAVLLFAVSRLYLLFVFTPDQSDIPWVYEPYVLEHAQAVSQQRPLFAFHAEQFERTRAAEQAAGRPGPAEEAHWIEYPPLALRLVLLPELFLAPLPARASGDYAHAFRAVIAGADALGFALLLFAVPRFFRREGPQRHLERWLAYIVGGHVLGHLLYDRLTLPTGVLVLAATALLMLPRAPVLAAFAALVAAVNYQLSPLVLTPILALGALPVSVLRGPALAWLRAGAGRAALLLTLVVLLFAPFYLYEGPASVGLFRFHGDRGVQIEAVPSTLPLVLSFFGYAVAPAGEYNSWSLRSSISPLLKQVATPLVGLLVLGTAWALVDAVRRKTPAASGPRTAVALGPAFAAFVAVSFAAAMIGSKVFSPQYLLWILPLVPLLPSAFARWLFVLVAGLTTVIFPYSYDHVAAWLQDPVTHEMIARGPTAIGKLLLVGRNALFVLFALVALRSARQAVATSA